MGNGANGEITPLVLKHATMEIKSESVPVPILLHLKEVNHAVEFHQNLEGVISMVHAQVGTFRVLCRERLSTN